MTSTVAPEATYLAWLDVTAVAERHLHPDRLTTLVVGDLEVIRDSLSGLGLGEPVALSAESF